MIQKINIVDAMCGMGKTSAAINYINSSAIDQKFLYITPYLDEVERIIASCPDRRFVQPKNYGSKLRDIKRLFNEGRNIVSTHALFNMFDEEVIDIVKLYGYTLIMDEVADVVKPLEISKNDLEMLLNECVDITEDYTLRWKNSEYTGRFGEEKRLCDLGALYFYDNTALIWMFPVKTFVAFDEIFILTYMFDAQVQRYYYDFYNLEYNYLYVKGNSLDTYQFTEEVVDYIYPDYKQLIHIIDNEKMNKIGALETSLSKTWYERNKNNQCMPELQNNLSNYFRRIVNTPSNQNLWTTFKDYQKMLSGGGYAKGFLSCNARATNAYRGCISVAYVINRFLHPVVKNFFVHQNVRIEEDDYALSELIQWIFRSAIRDGKEINLYIPSKRMRELLINWTETLTQQNDLKELRK